MPAGGVIGDKTTTGDESLLPVYQIIQFITGREVWPNCTVIVWCTFNLGSIPISKPLRVFMIVQDLRIDVFQDKFWVQTREVNAEQI